MTTTGTGAGAFENPEDTRLDEGMRTATPSAETQSAGSPSSRGEETAREAGSPEPVSAHGFTHLDSAGSARMVDVADKPVSTREATASGRVQASPAVIALLEGAGMPKGDALGVARVAGIMAAKKTSELIPLCHPIAISAVSVHLEVVADSVQITATVRTSGRTGVEMEALTAVAAAGLAVIDMVKAVDKTAYIQHVQLETKTGGKSGPWQRPADHHNE